MEMTTQLYTGDILHCRGKSLLSKAIRWFTKGWCNHTAVAIEVWGQVYIVDAQKNGVNARPLNEWMKKYDYTVEVARPNLGPKDPKAFSIRAFSKIGVTAYDFNSLLIRHPLGVMTGKWKDKDKNESRMVCSEYVAWLMQIERSYRITPKDMRNYTHERNFSHYQYKHLK